MEDQVRSQDATSQTARVYHEIKWRIVYGRYRPGTHISEATLARVYRASRTPVREALARLSVDGYVVAGARRGFVIAPITISMVRNMVQLRRILDGAAAEAAARSATADEILQMRQLATYPAGSAEDLLRQALNGNVGFHLAVARATHNDLLVDTTNYCLMQVYRVLSLGGDIARFEEGAADEHHAIVDAIERRDPAQARAAAERHLDQRAALIMSNVIDGRIKGVAV